MKIFEERCVMTLCTPTKKVLWVSCIPESRIRDKKRRAVTITTTGVIPNVFRLLFHSSKREMASRAREMFNAEIVGNLYAGRLWFLKLSRMEKKKACRLGKSLAQAQSMC